MSHLAAAALIFLCFTAAVACLEIASIRKRLDRLERFAHNADDDIAIIQEEMGL